MNILLLNWRDIKNPHGGGAEILTHEIARKWVASGNNVTQISSGFLDGKKEESVDGVKIIRLGKWWNVHPLALFYYLGNLRKETDVIVDEVHWFPFFSIFYGRDKTVLLACEVANRLFFELFPYPLAIIGRTIEKMYLFLYRNIPTLTISLSTKKDLIREGFPEQNITVLPMGVNAPKRLKLYPKEKRPTIMYLGRFNKQKGIDDVIEAFKFIKKEFPESTLWIVGKGDFGYIEKVKRKVKKLFPVDSVRFFGFVSEAKKFELLSKAHVLLFPSVHEGWGLVIVEAGIVGTPTIAYDIAGVRDILRNGRGVIVESKKPSALAKGAIDLLTNESYYKDVAKKLTSFRENIGWEKTASAAFEVLERRVC